MIYLIIGHRGVGKSSWLITLKKLFKTSRILDLDQEIEKKTGQKIYDFFSSDKEIKKFRLLEEKILNKIIDKYKKSKNQKTFIAVGAGFKERLTKSRRDLCTIIHLSRETDADGRIFFNRPRLKKTLSSLQEYRYLYPLRERFYKKFRDEILILPEQDLKFKELEKIFFNLKKFSKFKASITLNKDTLPNDKKRWPEFIKKRLKWGINFFELRDDQPSIKNLRILLKIIPKKHQLLSFRKKTASFFDKKSKDFYDWPLEKGSPPLNPPILSLHKRKQESVTSLCKKLTRSKAQYFKLAIPIKNFKELYQGHLWFLGSKKKHIFLPVSIKGLSWRWYRQIFGPQMSLHFIRESPEGLEDQPYLYEHLLNLTSGDKKSSAFAAVLGYPIRHSASPAFHRHFFLKKMIFVKIPLKEKEFTKKNLDILQKMGLKFAAVTSPLKKKACQICDEVEASAQDLKSVNTIVFKNNKWWGCNTDIYGLQALLSQKNIKQSGSKVVVWGGGGMRKILEKELPLASFYSARTGQCRKGNPFKKSSPNFLIWAVGRDRMDICKFPPRSWKPGTIIDLNYSEDSPGKELAYRVKAHYVSGKIMFQKQALKQQEFFLKIHKNELPSPSYRLRKEV